MRDHPHTPISQPGKTGEKPKREVSASLEDPEEIQEFIRSVHEILKPRLMHSVSEELKAEVVYFNRTILMTPPHILNQYRPQVELLSQLIAQSPSNIKVIRGLRFNLGNAISRHQYGVTWVLRYISGQTPLIAVVSALFSMFVLLCMASILVIDLHLMGSNLSKDMYETYSLLLIVNELPINSVMIIVHSAFIGSVVSVIARVNHFLYVVPFSPFLIYFSVLTRPLIAVNFAIFVFAIIKAGVISTLVTDLNGSTGSYFLYAVGFLCGFSERFAKDIMTRASGPLGGKGEEERSNSSRD